MLTIGQGDSPLIEIDGGSILGAVAFAPNGEHLVCGGNKGVRVWQAEDSKQVAGMEVDYVKCLAVSKDGRWIAVGTSNGVVIVWDAKTYEKVFSHRDSIFGIFGVDFLPDSTRLVSASDNCTATIWDIATRKRVQTLKHDHWVIAAKYSAQHYRQIMVVSCRIFGCHVNQCHQTTRECPRCQRAVSSKFGLRKHHSYF